MLGIMAVSTIICRVFFANSGGMSFHILPPIAYARLKPKMGFLLPLILGATIISCAGGGGGGGGGASLRPVDPSSISSPTIIPQSNGAVLTWVNPTRISIPISNYNITATPHSVSESIISRIVPFMGNGTMQNYTFSGLTNGVYYDFTLLFEFSDGTKSAPILLFSRRAVGPNKDGDEFADIQDRDIDNDGLDNDRDDCADGEIGWISNTKTDSDGDGCRDAGEDTDDDNDNFPDIVDVDDDGDSIIDIGNASEFNMIRYNMAGTNLTRSAGGRGDSTGCGGRPGIPTECNGYELVANISLAGYDNWDPIGDCSNNNKCDDSFDSFLEGNDYTISDVRIDVTLDYGIGVFAAVTPDASFRNIRINNLTVTASGGGDDFGSLVGYGRNAEFRNIIVKNISVTAPNIRGVGGLVGDGVGVIVESSSVDAENIIGQVWVGGLVGWGDPGTDGVRIFSSSVTADTIRGSEVGGLLGRGKNAHIYSSSTDAREIVVDATNNPRWGGGLVGNGENARIINSSVNAGIISGSENSENVGGLVGYGKNARIINSSVKAGIIRGSVGVGGLLGYGANARISSSSTDAREIVVDATNNPRWGGGLVGWGDDLYISSSSVNVGIIRGGTSIGGLVGDGGGATISSSLVFADTISAAKRDGYSNLGGLMGRGRGAAIFSSSVFAGTITGTGNYVGGLVGNSWQHNISSSLVVVRNINGMNHVGGLVGEGQNAFIYSSLVMGGSIRGGSFVGGIVGANTNTGLYPKAVGETYWLASINFTDAQPLPTNTFGNAMTETQLQTQTNFNGIYSGWGIAWCDPATGDYITDSSNTLAIDANRVWDLGRGDQFPVLRCLDLSQDQQREEIRVQYKDFDRDGIDNNLDACSVGEKGWTSNPSTDNDGDGCRDVSEDDDDDNDKVPDTADSCSSGDTGWISNASNDIDGDGCRDVSEDDDDDNDRVPDTADSCSLGETGWTSNVSDDNDGDGCRDVSEDDDDDNDRVPDTADSCSSGDTGWISNASNDIDGDGCRDVSEDDDDDNDKVADTADSCSSGETGWVSNASNDIDGDGCRDVTEDDDDDNDRVPDTADSCSSGETGWISSAGNDNDGDGCRDATEDDDDDNDRLPDTADNCYLIANINQTDSDGDNYGDVCDVDYDGDGLIDISTAEEFNNIRYNLAGTSLATGIGELVNSMSCGNGTRVGIDITECNGYELFADISLANWTNWEPIGNCIVGGGCSNSFTGNFDGNNHSISDIRIDLSAPEKGVGVFGAVSPNTYLRNLNLANISITSNSGGNSFGVLVGYGPNAEVHYIAVQDANINAPSASSMGGLIGDGRGAIISSSSVVSGTISGGATYVGGLLGHGRGSTVSSSSVVAHSISGSNSVGGLLGYGQDATVSSSSVVAHSISGSSEVGGLLGWGQNSTASSSSVVAHSISGSSFYAGGLIGRGDSSTVSSSSVVAHSISGFGAVGGLIGWGMSSTVSSSLVLGGSLSGTSHVGGIVGASGGASRNPRDVSNSYWLDSIVFTAAQPNATTNTFGESKSESEIQSPTTFTGIYADWEDIWCDPATGEFTTSPTHRLATAGGGDTYRVWDLGSATEHPVIRCFGNRLTPAQQRAATTKVLNDESPLPLSAP